MTSEQNRILRYLQYAHSGRDKAISARALSKQFGIRERGVREIIHELRVQHMPVCSDPAIGIWWPLDREDAKPAVDNLAKLFKPVREAKDGLEAGLDATFGNPTLFDQQEATG